MLTLPDYFDDLLSNIEPKGERKDKAVDIPPKVRDFLKECKAVKTLEPHTRLAGSYARSTAVKEIKDVDILLFVEPTYKGECSTEAILNIVFNALYNLPEALDDEGEVTTRRHQRRSVNVHLENNNLDLDIVPVILETDLDSPLLIPDKDWNEWVPTHPLGYADKLSQLNGDNGEKVVRLIKMFKHWRDVHMINRRPKSYWLELMMYHRIANGSVVTSGLSYAVIFRDLLSVIHKDFLPTLENTEDAPEICDPMLPEKNVAFNWERNHFETFMRRMGETIKIANQALELPNEDKSTAVELWQKIFGADFFPAMSGLEKVQNARSAYKNGEVFVEQGTGKVLLNPPTPSPQSIQVKNNRFYGEE